MVAAMATGGHFSAPVLVVMVVVMMVVGLLLLLPPPPAPPLTPCCLGNRLLFLVIVAPPLFWGCVRGCDRLLHLNMQHTFVHEVDSCVAEWIYTVQWTPSNPAARQSVLIRGVASFSGSGFVLYSGLPLIRPSLGPVRVS